MKLPQDYETLTPKERREVRELYIRRQKGKCYYCRHDLFKDPPKKIRDKEIDWGMFPKYFLSHPIHLQHNHYTGMTEGAVHAYCNAVMWQYEDR